MNLQKHWCQFEYMTKETDYLKKILVKYFRLFKNIKQLYIYNNSYYYNNNNYYQLHIQIYISVVCVETFWAIIRKTNPCLLSQIIK